MCIWIRQNPEKTETPAGGVVARFPGTNELAGLVMETAYIPIFTKLPSPSEADMLDLVKPAQMMYAGNGYTQAVEGFTHAKDLRFLRQALQPKMTAVHSLCIHSSCGLTSWTAM